MRGRPGPEGAFRIGDQFLPGLGEVALDAGAAGYPGGRLAETRRHGQGISLVEEQEGMDAVSLFEREKVFPPEVLLDGQLRRLGIGQLADDSRDVEGCGSDGLELGQIEARGPDAALADYELEASFDGPQEDGLDHALG